MSYLPKQEENQFAPVGQTSNNPAGEAPEAPPTQSGGSVGDEGAGGTAKGSATGSPTQFGSSASKLGDYLSANAPQIGAQADKVVGKFNDQYGQLNQGITNAANQFNQQVQSGYTAPDQNIVNQAVSNPTQFTATPENIAKFQAQYSDQYTGPQNFESFAPYAQVQGDVQNAVQQGNLLQNQAGLASYLQGNSKNPTRAASTLDSLLLSGNPEAQKKIQDAGKKFGDLTGQLDTAKTTANQSVTDAQKAAQDAATYAQGQINPYAQNFNTTLNQNAKTAEQQRLSYNAAQNGLRNQAFPLQQAMDIYANKVGGTFSTNPLTQYLNSQPSVNPATAANTASAQDYQTSAALEKLLGNNFNEPLDQATADQAGTYKSQTSPTLDFNPIVQSLGDQAQVLGKGKNSQDFYDFIRELSKYAPDQFNWNAGSDPNEQNPSLFKWR